VVNIISCPTCGRIEADLVKAVADVEKRIAHIKKPIDVSIMVVSKCHWGG